MKFTPNGTECYLQRLNGSAAAPILITNLTNAAPAVATVSDTGTLANGDLVTVAGTATNLDGNTYMADSVGEPANTVTLVGSDNSAATAPAAAGTLTEVPTGDMLRFCLSSYEREIEAADAIDVSTFCGTESLAGTPLPGNISIEGFIDFDVAAYMEWMRAVQDGRRRVFHIVLPNGIGDIVQTITPTGLTETLETNEAASFEGSAVLNTWPTYVIA